MAQESKAVRYDKQGHVAVVTLNRPHRGNSIGGTMNEELAQVWQDAKEDKSVRVVIITGAGERHFCTGMDVVEAAEGGGPGSGGGTHEFEDLKFTPWHARLWKPVICAVNGICAGGGLHFVVDSDIVICSENATFMDPHVTVGQVAALEPIALARRIPLAWVFRLAFTGGLERMDARTALEIGLVTEVVPQAELLPKSMALAGKIAENSPAALASTKKAVWNSLELGLTDACKLGWELLKAHWSHPDQKEGPRAFVEKRKPRWTA